MAQKQRRGTNFKRMKSPTRKCPSCNQALPASAPEVVEAASDHSEMEGVARDLDSFDVVIIRSLVRTKKELVPIFKALQKRFPKWKGTIWHLRPDEKLEHLPISVVQNIYEALLTRFDPDLFKIREERKARAIEEAAKDEEKKHEMTANDVADRLERIVVDRDTEHAQNVAEATRRLEEARAEGRREPHRDAQEEAQGGGDDRPLGRGE